MAITADVLICDSVPLAVQVGSGLRGLSPEDSGGVAVDLVEQIIDPG
jgi:hypothetical protein